MYPYINKKLYFAYEDSKFVLWFVNGSILKIEGSLGDTEVSEIVEYVAILVEKNVYQVYWFEPKSKHLVVQVQNFNNMRVYSNVVNMVTTEFFHMKGKMTPMKDDEIPTDPSKPEPQKGEKNSS